MRRTRRWIPCSPEKAGMPAPHSFRKFFFASVLALGCGSVATAQPFFQNDFQQDGAQTVEDVARKAAEAAYQKGDFAKTIEISTNLINQSRTDFVALYLRASAKIEIGKATRNAALLREAITDARDALSQQGKKNPWLYIPYMHGMVALAEVEEEPAHVDVVLKVIDPVLQRTDLETEPRSQLFYQRGLARLIRNDAPKAIADLKETLKLNPLHLGALMKLAQAQKANQQVDAALTTYDMAAKAYPKMALIPNERGVMRRSTNSLDGAVADFTLAIKLDPTFVMAYMNRGITLADQNSEQSAEADFSEVIRQQPKEAMAYHLRGAARVAQGKFDTGIADYTVALRLTPKNMGALEDRGFARFYKKDYVQAAEDFAAVLKVTPNANHLVPWRAMSLLRAGESDQATDVLDKFLEKPSDQTGWIGTLAGFLRGKVTEEALLAAAKSAKGDAVPANQCEAEFFIGQMALHNRDMPAAQEHFARSVGTTMFRLAAHRGAKFELGR